MFSELMTNIKSEVLTNLFRSTTNLMAFENFLTSLPFNLPIQKADSIARPETAGAAASRREMSVPSRTNQPQSNGEELELLIPTVRKETQKVGRNDPCPCGSGKKYKNCCGRLA
ncbi:MAG: SEC-C domain-containing protein [Verrucomicrobia bacterium]|nr:SEC-C domain-containing protein [Verrucomicrobiota bacterium]